MYDEKIIIIFYNSHKRNTNNGIIRNIYYKLTKIINKKVWKKSYKKKIKFKPRGSNDIKRERELFHCDGFEEERLW